jgi:hypothetical protein
MCWRWKFKSVVQPTVSTNHWQSDLTFVRSGHWELFWSVGISRMICQSDRWLDSGWEKCKCTPADMVIHHWFLLVKNCQIDHVAERVGVVFFAFCSFAWSYVNHVSGRTTDKDCWVLPAQPKQWQAATWTQIASSGWWLLQVDVSCPSRV